MVRLDGARGVRCPSRFDIGGVVEFELRVQDLNKRPGFPSAAGSLGFFEPMQTALAELGEFLDGARRPGDRRGDRACVVAQTEVQAQVGLA